MALNLAPHEQEVLYPWYFWLSLACSSLDSQKLLGRRCFESLQSAQESGLTWGPPCIVVPLVLSLNPNVKAQSEIHSLSNHKQLSIEQREKLKQLLYLWETIPAFKTLWPLAKRKLLLIDQSLISQLIGFCIAEIINYQLDLMNSHQRDLLKKNTLDLTSLRLLLDENDYPSSTMSLSLNNEYTTLHSQPSSRQQNKQLDDLSLLGLFLHPQPQKAHSDHNQLQLKPERFGLVKYFEALYQPSRRLLYIRLTRAQEQLNHSSTYPFKEIDLKKRSRARYISEEISQTGAIKALGRSGRLEHLTYSEWAYLDEEIIPNLNYFFLKWAENDLVYLERDHQQRQKSKWSISHHYTDPLHLSSSSQIDEKFGLSILSWAHLVSLQVSQALEVYLGKQSLTVNWFWKNLTKQQEKLRKQKVIHEFCDAEREVFSLLNPLITTSKFTLFDQKPLQYKLYDSPSMSQAKVSPVNQIKVIYSSQAPSQLAPYELHLCLGQQGQWHIHLRPEYISHLKLNSRWLSSLDFVPLTDHQEHTNSQSTLRSFSYLNLSLSHILFLMIQHIDKQS